MNRLRMTLADALREGERILDESRVSAPGMTSRVLLADALGRDQAWLVAHSQDTIDRGCLDAFHEMVRSRRAGVPTQYIRGFQEFYELEFNVTPDVFIPRPETEHLLEAALDRVRDRDRVVDIGTGSGAIAVTLARHVPRASVVASDVSLAAVRVAAANARRHGVDVAFCVTDLCEAFGKERFDIVISNPPYVPLRSKPGLQRELQFEPPTALFGGEDGLGILQRLVDEVPRILKPRGWLLAEIGFDSRTAVRRLLDGPDWRTPQFLPDLAGIDRVVAVRRA